MKISIKIVPLNEVKLKDKAKDSKLVTKHEKILKIRDNEIERLKIDNMELLRNLSNK